MAFRLINSLARVPAVAASVGRDCPLSAPVVRHAGAAPFYHLVAPRLLGRSTLCSITDARQYFQALASGTACVPHRFSTKVLGLGIIRPLIEHEPVQPRVIEPPLPTDLAKPMIATDRKMRRL